MIVVGSQQHASVSLGRICSENCTCCCTEIEVDDHIFFYLTANGEVATAVPNFKGGHGSL